MVFSPLFLSHLIFLKQTSEISVNIKTRFHNNNKCRALHVTWRWFADINHCTCIVYSSNCFFFSFTFSYESKQLSAIRYHYLKKIFYFYFYTHELHHKCMETFFCTRYSMLVMNYEFLVKFFLRVYAWMSLFFRGKEMFLTKICVSCFNTLLPPDYLFSLTLYGNFFSILQNHFQYYFYFLNILGGYLLLIGFSAHHLR